MIVVLVLAGLLTGGVAYNYWLPHSADVQTEMTGSRFYLKAENHPHHLQVKFRNKKYEELYSPSGLNGVVLPNGQLFLVTLDKLQDDSYRSKYIKIGSIVDGSIRLNMVDRVYYDTDFSLAGDRYSYFFDLKTKDSLTAGQLEGRFSQRLKRKLRRVSLEVEGLSVAEAEESGHSFRLTVDIPGDRTYEVTKDSGLFDPDEPYDFLLVGRTNSTTPDYIFMKQGPRVYDVGMEISVLGRLP